MRRARAKQRIIAVRRMPKRRIRGGALSDWIPSSVSNAYNSAANAVSTARDAYNVYRDFNSGPEPELPKPITSTQSYGDFSFLEDGPEFNQGVQFEPIPEAPPAPPVYQWRPTIFKKKVKSSPLPPYVPSSPKPQTLLSKIRAYKPISTIDSALRTIGVRDKVRGALNKSELGRYLVTGADYAMKKGFGAPKKYRRRAVSRMAVTKCGIRPAGVIRINGGCKCVRGGSYLAFKPAQSQIQSVVVRRQGKLKKVAAASKWVRSHGYHPIKHADIKPHTIRYRLHKPKANASYYMVHDPKNKAVMYDVMGAKRKKRLLSS